MNRPAPPNIRRVDMSVPGGIPPRPPRDSGIGFSTTEIVSILVSMVTLVLAFHMFNITDAGIILGVVLGITVHEIAHKLVAQSMGLKSEYELWFIGLVLVLAFAIISRGKFIFAAPGFVVTEGMATIRERGFISLSAPFANILLALLFLVIGGPVGASAAYVNILLAGFNLLPVGPLDGRAVMEWNPTVWSGCFVFVLLIGLVFLL